MTTPIKTPKGVVTFPRRYVLVDQTSDPTLPCSPPRRGRVYANYRQSTEAAAKYNLRVLAYGWVLARYPEECAALKPIAPPKHSPDQHE
jgi:hypothetical protein